MNVKDENRPYLIAARMKRWLEIVQTPLFDLRCPTWKARRNYLKLVRRYPEIANALGYTEALSFPSPLHGLWSPVQQQAPQQEVSTDIIDPATQQRVGRAMSPASGVPPRMISLKDEIL
jgi:hypothetical protein